MRIISDLKTMGMRSFQKGFPGGSLVKDPPATQETQVQSLGWEEPLEEGMATPSSILAWRIRMNRGAWRAAFHGVAESQTGLND